MSADEMISYLFADSLAFERLCAQPECSAVERNFKVLGYEGYIIEQWAVERRSNTVVASFTGNQQHELYVNILLVPKDSQLWSSVTFNFFEELLRMHILPKDIPQGRMLVTNLGSLPSNLNLVAIPSSYLLGFPRFIVNEDLRRLGCVGRMVVTAEEPSEAVVANFRQMFKIDWSVPGTFAVRELVTLLQLSLFYFDFLHPQYVDGLLCDYTLRALQQWWAQFGFKRFRKPSPTEKLYLVISITALVGSVTGCRQRLRALNFSPPKDPFDPENFLLAIRRFQKSERLPKTQKLDEATFWKLINSSGKQVDSNRDLLRAMKSTVKEGFSGKALSVMDDWETTNLETLAKNIRGPRGRYLWQGKEAPKRHIGNITSVGKVSGIPTVSLLTYDDSVASEKHGILSRRKEAHTSHELQVSTISEASPNERFRYAEHGRSDSGWFQFHQPHEDKQEHTASHGSAISPEKPKEHLGHSLLLGKSHDDSEIKQKSAAGDWDNISLRPCLSLSEVEEAVCPTGVGGPDVSEEELSRLTADYKRLSFEVQSILPKGFQRIKKLTEDAKAHEKQLNSEYRSQSLLRFQVRASNRKETSVRSRMNELEALKSRLDYESGALNLQLTELEQSINLFATKVSSLESRWYNYTHRAKSFLALIFGLA